MLRFGNALSLLQQDAAQAAYLVAGIAFGGTGCLLFTDKFDLVMAVQYKMGIGIRHQRVVPGSSRQPGLLRIGRVARRVGIIL